MELIRYLTFLLQDGLAHWNQFWFEPVPIRRLGITRIALALVSILYVATWWSDLGNWIEGGSILDRNTMVALDAADQLDSATSRFDYRPSLLFFSGTKAVATVYLASTILVAILVALGIGGRWTAALLFILVLGIVHRIHFLTGPVDYLLTAMLGYFVIHSGKEEKLLSVGIEGTNTSILETLAQRLLQVHYYGWLLLCFFSHQAGLIWWQGEASWWLAASGRNSFFGTEELYLQSWLVNGLTHATIGVLLVAILSIPFAKTRPLGWIATLIYWCLVAFLSSEAIYAAVGIAASLCFFTLPRQAMESPIRASEAAYPAKRVS